MYSAEFTITRGFGVEKKTVKADSYKELNEKVEKAMKFFEKETVLLGYICTWTIEKIVYSYPSGKKFVKKFA